MSGAKEAALHDPVVVCNGYINHRVDAYGAWPRLINSCRVIKFDAEGHWPIESTIDLCVIAITQSDFLFD